MSLACTSVLNWILYTVLTAQMCHIIRFNFIVSVVYKGTHSAAFDGKFHSQKCYPEERTSQSAAVRNQQEKNLTNLAVTVVILRDLKK